METEVRIQGNLVKFLSNVCEQRESYCEAAFDRKLFRPVHTVPARFLDDFER